MLSEIQTKYIEKSFTEFAESLDGEQLSKLYFRLNDLLMYSHDSLQVAHNIVSKLRSIEILNSYIKHVVVKVD